jgi:hypothetical protein
MGFAIPILLRIVSAAEVVWTLLSDRATARRLPWRYLKHRLVRDPRMIIQLAGIVAATVAYPLVFILPEGARSPGIAIAASVWLVAAFGPWAERAFLRRRRGRPTA